MGTSYQKGWVSLRGKKWYGYFRRTVLDPETNQPKTVSSPVALGLKSEMTKSRAREKLAQEITRLSGQITEDGSVKNGTVTFESVNGLLDLAVHVISCVQYALTPVPLFVSVSEFDRFALACRCAGGNFRRGLHAVGQCCGDGQGGISSGVEDFECFKFHDFRHDDYLFSATGPLVLKNSMICC